MFDRSTQSTAQPLNHTTYISMHVDSCSDITQYHCKFSSLTQPLTPACLFCNTADNFISKLIDTFFLSSLTVDKWVTIYYCWIAGDKTQAAETSLIFPFISVFRAGCEWVGSGSGVRLVNKPYLISSDLGSSVDQCGLSLYMSAD